VIASLNGTTPGGWLDYATLMRHEHVNTAREIEAVARVFFREVRVARMPTPLLHASLYSYLEAERPDTDRCREYLEGRSLEPETGEKEVPRTS